MTSKRFSTKKGGRGQDVTEGKRSLIVIHTLEKAKPIDKKRLISILKMHTSDQKLKDEAIQIMTRYGAIEYAEQFAEKLVAESWKEVDRLLPPSDAKDTLQAFAEHLIKRKI